MNPPTEIVFQLEQSERDWERGKDITASHDLSFAFFGENSRATYEFPLPRGHFSAFTPGGISILPIDRAFAEATAMINRPIETSLGYTADDILRPLQPPRGERDTLLDERQSLKNLHASKQQYGARSSERKCIDVAMKGYFVATIGRMLWASWDDETRQIFLNRLKDALKHASCPEDVKEVIQESGDILSEDSKALAFDPTEKDKDNSDLTTNAGLSNMVQEIKRALLKWLGDGNVFAGANPNAPILPRIRFVLGNKIGWNSKVEILCMAMVIFPGYWFRPSSLALQAVERENDEYLR